MKNQKLEKCLENMICLKCRSKAFEIKSTETGNMNIVCISCGSEISPLHPDMRIKEFLEFWIIGKTYINDD